MAYPEKKNPVRGSERSLKNARIEIYNGLQTSKTGKKFLNVSFFAPVDATQTNSDEIKVKATLWEAEAEKYSRAPSQARFDVSGYEKVGRPYTNKWGNLTTPTEFVPTSIVSRNKAAAPKPTEPVEEVEEWEDGSEIIPF